MDRAECRALHAALLERVQAAPVDMGVLMGLMQEYHALTARLNESARLANSVHMHALNAELLSVLTGKLSQAFIAACNAMYG
jgi:S-adenosylhomocysteine hydrolase